MSRGIGLKSVVLVAAFGWSLGGCASKPSGGAGEAPSGSVERFYIVDCLLPAQVRKLGRSLTYLAPQRAVKTSASDCEIRGGEYVSYDRADYATALRVWLPLAQENDKAAQTYVGEIYERGLGVAPDYGLAAAWYRKAAAQSYARAQINLGNLYERGLGVQKDLTIALDWYRRASGLTEGVAIDSASLASEMRQEMDRLRQEADQQRAETEAVRAQLLSVTRELTNAQRELARRGAEVTAERQQVDLARRELERARADAQVTRDDARARADAQVRTLEIELQRRQTELERQQQELAGWTDRVARLADAERRQRDEIQGLRVQVEDARRQLASAQRELTRRGSETEVARQQVEQARLDLESARRDAQVTRDDARARADAQVRALEAELQRRQAELDQQRRELNDWRERVTRLEREVAPPAREPVVMAGPSIEMIEPSVMRTRGVAVVQVASGSTNERIVVGRVSAPAGLMALVVNDREETVDGNGLFRTRIAVPSGGSLVKVVAVDRQGKRGDFEFRLASAAADVATRKPPKLTDGIKLGTYYALVIGNVGYSQWPKLKTAEADASATAELLAKRYGFKTRLLLNAKRYDILQALNDLRNQLTEDDNLLIYYAGHGYLDEKINRAYWVPVDGALDSNADWIPTVAITDLVGAISARHVLIVADSCYAGALTRSALARLEAGMTDEVRRHWIQVVASKRSRTVLSSGEVKPVLDSGGGTHSVFARAWLDVLNKNDDVLDGQRLHREIAARVSYAADALKFEQVPQYAPVRYAGHESGDFLFVPTTASDR